jgi:Zn-dependent M28 family amino/carboxypeptidase
LAYNTLANLTAAIQKIPTPLQGCTMLIARSQKRKPKKTDAAIAELLQSVSTKKLREYVDMLAFPRHYSAERQANIRARDLLLKKLHSFGYAPVLQGGYHNIVATSSGAEEVPYILLGAHYDSVPGSPGADDNASAVAVCLECARLAKANDIGRAMIVLFNREEDGLLGSRQFVASLGPTSAWAVKEAHIFEMVGFRTHARGSQRMPPGLPGLAAPDVGDFLGLLANRRSNAIAEEILTLAATYVSEPPVLALKIYFGIEKYFAHLLRSDHTPFWEAGIPSLMWTDTSEFRNPHYHRVSDTPDTLDYDFLTQVTKLTLARVASRG